MHKKALTSFHSLLPIARVYRTTTGKTATKPKLLTLCSKSFIVNMIKLTPKKKGRKR